MSATAENPEVTAQPKVEETTKAVEQQAEEKKEETVSAVGVCTTGDRSFAIFVLLRSIC
jgi:hypothetical protein